MNSPHCRMLLLGSLTCSSLRTMVMKAHLQFLSSTLKQHTLCKLGARLPPMRLKGRWPTPIYADGPCTLHAQEHSDCVRIFL